MSRRCMWAVEGECGPQGCEGCEHGGSGDDFRELFIEAGAIHDSRCGGDWCHCGGVGGVPDSGPGGSMAMSCLYCGGDGKCHGCGPKLDPGSYTVDPYGRVLLDSPIAPQPLAQLEYDVEYVCALGRGGMINRESDPYTYGGFTTYDPF